MLIVPGRAALSAARLARAVAKGRAVCPGLRGLTPRWLHLVVTARPLTAAEAAQLDAMLAYGPLDEGPGVSPAAVAVYAMQRSIRAIAASPHTWAMSVAFDDHGEVVPIRGAT